MEEGVIPESMLADGSAEPALHAKPGKVQSFNCPSCAGTIAINAVGQSVTAVCQHCSSVIDVANENFQIIEKAFKNTRRTHIEMGSRGRLQGLDWQVTGYLEKTDGTGMYAWEEYLLFNPYHGYRFLIQSNGHWSIAKVIRKSIAGAGSNRQLEFDGQQFQLFLRGKAVVRYVKGEFYWRVAVGDIVDATDYIAPPLMLSVERNKHEVNISLCEYVAAKDVVSAFEFVQPPPYRHSVAPNQPAPFQGALAKIWLTAGAAFAALFATQLVSNSYSDNQIVYAQSTQIMATLKGKDMSSPSFTLPEDGNILIESNAPLYNNWAELGISLVNEQTNEEYEVSQAIEYYSGYDSDGSWTEGSQNAQTFLSGVPKGKYKLLLNTDAGAFSQKQSLDLSLNVKRDVPTWTNFWFSFFLIMLLPPILLAWRWIFESRRWAESDFAPYHFTALQSGDDT